MGRVLLAGAGGFIGSHCLEVLLEGGHPCVAADRPGVPRSPSANGRTPWVAMDLLEPASLAGALEGVDAVVNATGLFGLNYPSRQLHAINATGSERLALAAARAGVRRLVHLSSTGVYGRPRRTPCGESDPKRPGNAYERSKWAGELRVRAVARRTGLPLVVLRPTLVYGPRSSYGLSMFVALIALASRGALPRVPRLVGHRRGHHVHVRDLARAVRLALERPEAVGQVYNVADREVVTNDRMALWLIERLGGAAGPALPGAAFHAADALLAVLPEALVLAPFNAWIRRDWDRLVRRRGLSGALRPRLDREWLLYLLHDHAYRVDALEGLGMEWEFPRLEEGLEQTLDWYRSERWIP
ncbi:MAG: NAD(P)-dependent oxidoreductase [Planctomycetes bacterium]|nr:NAD(P)-dependent oxidoreductase [Planctomycetota bacterium]